MSKVWFACPSIRPSAEAQRRIDVWRKQGCSVALMRQGSSVDCELLVPTAKYIGWPASTNHLAQSLLADPEMRWVVGGGDDTLPDLAHTADEIAAQCEEHFGGTLGIMQATGDRWGDDATSRRMFGVHRGALIDRVAGSPWMGREWIRRAYQGQGPMPGMYWHSYADEELQEVAEGMGLFWQRRDLIHMHEHCQRAEPENKPKSQAPDWHRAATGGVNWVLDKSLFARRKAAGFPGKDLLPLSAGIDR